MFSIRDPAHAGNWTPTVEFASHFDNHRLRTHKYSRRYGEKRKRISGKMKCSCKHPPPPPANTRRCFDVVSTLFERYGRQMDVETTLCASGTKPFQLFCYFFSIIVQRFQRMESVFPFRGCDTRLDRSSLLSATFNERSETWHEGYCQRPRNSHTAKQ